MNENDLKSRLDAELSNITWSVRNSNAVRQQVNQGGTVMKKKLSISFYRRYCASACACSSRICRNGSISSNQH